MSSVETQQVTLKLTDLPFVLRELKARRRITTDPRTGDDIFHIQFDSQDFVFRRSKDGRTNRITVGHNVAQALLRDAYLIIGDALSGEMTDILEIVEEFTIGTGQEAGQIRSKTTCPVCQEECGSVNFLAEHIIEKHATKAKPSAQGDDGFVIDPGASTSVPEISNDDGTEVGGAETASHPPARASRRAASTSNANS